MKIRNLEFSQDDFHTWRNLSAMFALSALILCIVQGTAQAQNANLGKVLHQVEAYAPALKAAQANSDAFRAKRSVARSRFLGEADAFAHSLSFNDNRLTRPISPPINFSAFSFDDNQIGYGGSFQLPLDINGRLRNGFHASSHQAKAAAENAANVRLVLLNRAALLYRGLERIAGQRLALQKQMEALKGHIRVAETAIEVGRIAAVERLRLVAELKVVEGRLAGLDGVEAGLRARLASLLEKQTFTDSVLIPTREPVFLIAPKDSIANRPDVRAAGEIEEAAHSGVKAAWAAYFPDFFAGFTWLQNQGYNGSGANDATWEVVIQARLPIWTGGRRQAQIGQAKAQRRAAQYQRKAVKEGALAELVAARGSWSAAKAQYRAAQSAVIAAEEVTRIQTDRFDAGRLSATDLVDAEAALAGSRSELASSLARWWQADDALRLALGSTPVAYDDYGGTAE